MMGVGGMTGWLVFLVVLLVAAVVTAVVTARMLSARRRTELPPGPREQAPGPDEAEAALRMRYASGQISREEYLQGKVELED